MESIVAEYEEEIKNIELKYDAKLKSFLEKRKQIVNEISISESDKLNNTNSESNNTSKSLPNFWLNALSNHRLFKDFINKSVDEKPLQHLIDIRYEKINDGTVRLKII